MANGNGITAGELISALESAKGYVSLAAKTLGVSRQSFYNYMKKYPTVQQRLDDIRDERTDWVEGKLLEQIRNDNLTAIIFYLKTQAKDRGYSERHEITGAGGSSVQIKTIEIVKDYGSDSGE
jgi:hypothetical protein